MAIQSQCPAAEDLQQFLLAQLADAQAAGVERHILECGACCEAARRLTGSDTLVDAMRSGPTLTGELDFQVAPEVVLRLQHASPAGAGTARMAVPLARDRWNETIDQPAAATYDATRCLAPPQAAGEIGRLGPYAIQRILGQGGMGIVYLAQDPALNRLVALKVMRPDLAANQGSRQRFIREAQAVAAIEHDHIVPIYQVGEDRGIPYLAMQFLRGETLEARLRREGRPPLAEMIRIGLQISRGLAAAHDRGLIHRDIKPANIWLEEGTARAKLLDFGLARAIGGDPRLTQEGLFVGTPGYLAPEQAQNCGVDPRSDLFSLGCVLYELCTGEAAFRGADSMSMLLAVVRDQPMPPLGLNPAVPPALSDLVMQLLAKEPDRRPASAQQVIAALEGIERDGQAARQPVPRKPRGRRLVAALALLALGLLASYLIALNLIGGQTPTSAQPTAGPVPPAAANVPAVYPVAVLVFSERGGAVKDYGPKITDLLVARLAAAPNLHLVDRQDLERALAEQELALSGAVRPDQAARTGQLTGAKLLVTGSVFQVDKQVHIVAKVIGTETTCVLGAAVEGKASDELAPLVDALAKKIAETIDQQAKALVAAPLDRRDRLAALAKQLPAGKRPVLMVKIGERHVGPPILDPAAQTEVIYYCRGTGFEVVDADSAPVGKADVLIVGEGISETAGRRGTLLSVKARVEIKAIDRRTDKVLAIDRQTAVAVDLSEQIASKTALQEAAAAVAERMLPKLVKAP